ncbi:CubicO group peptidase, beta-lactamase class C family [Microlunatus flavus]|uniref:CubicO group peptidase, beta-lactamase class C family n=1 Tax=Microlunatus flavus TaxID=1036181 RepID=A0A1H9D3B6_9ACTN|nr:CubicO group peptidase, beta-lactamase class C family [Microlunatus flavus]
MTAPWSGSALVERAGTVVDELAEGFVDEATGTRWSARTRSQASSISKQVVAVVALALADRGDVDLHAPVGRVLPSAPSAWAPMTLHHLLTHTSGVGHWSELGLAPLTGDPPSPGDLVDLVLRTPLVGAPGGRWLYSSPGYAVAALLLESATQATYAALATELALAPAGLRSTTTGVFGLGADQPSSRAVAHGHHEGRPVHVAPGLAALPGTGDLWTTTEDLVAWSRALGDGAVLREPERLWARRAELPPDLSAGSVVGEAYGYGTFSGTVLGRPAWFVPGDNPGYASLLARMTGDATTIAVLADDDAAGTGPALARLAPSSNRG